MFQFHSISVFIFYDILEESPDISLWKMFGTSVIFYEKNARKIIFLFWEWEVFCRENPYISCLPENQFSYYNGKKEIFMKFFRIEEDIFENREKMWEIMHFFRKNL